MHLFAPILRKISNICIENQIIAEIREKFDVDEEDVRQTMLREDKDSHIYQEAQRVATRILHDSKVDKKVDKKYS